MGFMWNLSLAGIVFVFNFTDPMVATISFLGEGGDDLEDGVVEAADIENVLAIGGLGGGIGDDVETD